MKRCTLTLALALLAASGCKDKGAAPSAACADLAAAPMVHIAGGSFVMGDDPQYPEEGPPHVVKVDPFWIDSHELTNARVCRFCEGDRLSDDGGAVAAQAGGCAGRNAGAGISRVHRSDA